MFKGNWKFNLQHGEGQEVYNETEFNGEFRNGFKNGYGKLIFNDGSFFEG